MRRRKSHLQENLDSIREVEKLFSIARRFLAVVGAAFAIIFTYAQIKTISVAGTIQALDPDIFTRLALIGYYNSWIIASNLEFKLAQSVYTADPNRGKIPASMFFILPLLLAVGALLFLIRSDEKLLSIALVLFLVMDVILWINVRRLARPMAESSAKLYLKEGMYAGLERLRYYSKDYIRGPWQIYRYSAMACLSIFILVVCHVDAVRTYFVLRLHLSLPDVDAHKLWVLISYPESCF